MLDGGNMYEREDESGSHFVERRVDTKHVWQGVLKKRNNTNQGITIFL